MREPVELDQVARDVIASGREGPVPDDFVTERVRRAVTRVLDGSMPPARSRRRLGVPLLAALGAAALGGALYAMELVRRSEVALPPEPIFVPPREELPPAAPPEVATVPSSAPSALAPAPPPAEPRRPAARSQPAKSTRSQQLSAEIELLARVNAAVNAGDGGRALGLLAEYDETFRPPILAEERAAASVLALCAAGRTADARAAAERFHRRWQRSPLSGRVARSCAEER